jgi:ankyrin repeat protein
VSYNGRIYVLGALLKHGGDVNEIAGKEDINGPSGTPLYTAAAAGRENVVRLLLAHGADLTVKSIEGVSTEKHFGREGDGNIIEWGIE